MNRKLLLPAVAMVLVVLGCTANNAIGQERWLDVKLNYTFNPVEMVISRLLDRFIIDPVQERLGWKESQEELERRLVHEMQKNSAVLKSQQRERLRQLREDIRKCASRDELKNLAAKFKNDLKEINKRLDSDEEDIEWLKVKDEDRDNGTKNRNDPKYFLARGERYLASNEHFKALASARIACRLDDKLPEPYLLLGRVYTAKAATAVAVACFDRAIHLDPKNALAYRCRGQANLQEQNYKEAVADLTRSLQLDPKPDPSTCLWRAEALLRTGAYFGAIIDASQAIRLDPTNFQAYCVRGTAYYFLNDCPRTIADGSEAIRLNPKSPRAYCVRAMGYNDWTRNTRGKGLFAGFELDKKRRLAFQDCAEALRLDPRCAEAYYLQGVAGSARENFDMTESYAAAVRLDPRFANSYYKRDYAAAFRQKGVVEASHGNHDQAIVHFNKAIEVDSTDGDTYYERGYSYFRKADKDRALKDFKEALRLGTRSADMCNRFIETLSR